MNSKKSKFSLKVDFVTLSIFLAIMYALSCSTRQDTDAENEKNLAFVLEDSIKIDIPYAFSVATPEAEGSGILLYSHIDEHFFLLDYADENRLTEYYFRGDGPEEYSGILQFAGIYKEQPFFIDHQKILFYQPENHSLAPVRWHYPVPVKYGGMPTLSARFLNDNTLLMDNLVPSIFVKQSLNVKATLDTIPVWKYLEFDQESDRFEVRHEGFLNEKSAHYSDKRLFTYQFRSWMEEGQIFSVGKYINELLVFENLNNKYPSRAIEIDIPGFKNPEGFTQPLTIQNFQEINELESASSRIFKTYIMEGKELLLTYSLGNSSSHNKETSYKAYWFDYGEGKGEEVILPKEHGENSYWNDRIAYLGNNKFLFVQSNEKAEKNFHMGFIYRLEAAIE